MHLNYRILITLALSLSLAALNGCESNLASDASTLTVLPASVDIAAGTDGDTTFALFVAQLSGPNGDPVEGVDVDISGGFLHILDADGNNIEGGTPVTFQTDDNGQVVFFVETPLGRDYSDTILLHSASTNTAAIITASAPSS